MEDPHCPWVGHFKLQFLGLLVQPTTKAAPSLRRNPLLVIATMLAVLVSSFLVFTTLSARAIVENNTSRWQNGVHVVIFFPRCPEIC